jgi:hypothetical protein
MHGYAEHRNRQSRVEADLAVERGLALEAGWAPRMSGQLILWL